MKPESLIPDVHMTQEEIKYVFKIIGIIGQAGYSGPFNIVGSRTEGHYISYKRLKELLRIPKKTLEENYEYLNALAKAKKISSGSIPSLRYFIDFNTYPYLEKLFKQTYDISAELASDADLLLIKRPKGIQPIYFDDRSGLRVEIWENRKLWKC